MASKENGERREKTDIGGYSEERFAAEIDEYLKCSICLLVLRNPMQCPRRHYFCKSCIIEHLKTESNCPTCQDPLTLASLLPAPKLLLQLLAPLMISCDYACRGCPEFVTLQFLEIHETNCAYAPTRGMNAECQAIFNRSDKERHENDCDQSLIRQSSLEHFCETKTGIDDLMSSLASLNNELKDIGASFQEFKGQVRNALASMVAANRVANNIKRKIGEEMKAIMAEQRENFDEASKVDSNRRSITPATSRQRDRETVFVCGGYSRGQPSAEMYQLNGSTWTPLMFMRQPRSSASQFVYKQRVFVTGGWTNGGRTDTIEMMNTEENLLQWTDCPFQLPIKCSEHKTVVYQNTALLIGGINNDKKAHDSIYEIKLDPPYTTRLLSRLPQPRYNHGCAIIDDQILIAGGGTSSNFQDTVDTVYQYDLKSGQCKVLPPLPFAVRDMATVRWQDNIILMGGVNDVGRTLSTVIKYCVTSGDNELLPPMKLNRTGCAAVVIGNKIVVFGGYYSQKEHHLDSVECFDLDSNTWKDLQRMRVGRGFPVAVVMPKP